MQHHEKSGALGVAEKRGGIERALCAFGGNVADFPKMRQDFLAVAFYPAGRHVIDFQPQAVAEGAQPRLACLRHQRVNSGAYILCLHQILKQRRVVADEQQRVGFCIAGFELFGNADAFQKARHRGFRRDLEKQSGIYRQADADIEIGGFFADRLACFVITAAFVIDMQCQAAAAERAVAHKKNKGEDGDINYQNHRSLRARRF